MDCGNTRLKTALFNHNQCLARSSVAWSTLEQYASKGIDYAKTIAWEHPGFTQVTWIFVSDQNRKRRPLIEKICQEQFHMIPFYLQTDECSPLAEINLDGYSKNQLGIDRLAALVGARHKKLQGSLIILDAGSALTVEGLTEKGRYLGGAIAPGLQTLGDSLKTLNPRLKGQESSQDYTPSLLDGAGKTTEQCVDLGVQASFIGAAQFLVDTIQKSMPPKKIPSKKSRQVIATGGDGHHLVEAGVADIYMPELVLEGLNILSFKLEKIIQGDAI